MSPSLPPSPSSSSPTRPHIPNNAGCGSGSGEIERPLPGKEGLGGGLIATQDQAVQVEDFAIKDEDKVGAKGKGMETPRSDIGSAAMTPRNSGSTTGTQGNSEERPTTSSAIPATTRPKLSPVNSLESRMSPGSVGSSGVNQAGTGAGPGTPPMRVGTPVDLDSWNNFMNQYTAGQVHLMEFPIDRRKSPSHSSHASQASRRKRRASHHSSNTPVDPAGSVNMSARASTSATGTASRSGLVGDHGDTHTHTRTQSKLRSKPILGATSGSSPSSKEIGGHTRSSPAPTSLGVQISYEGGSSGKDRSKDALAFGEQTPVKGERGREHSPEAEHESRFGPSSGEADFTDQHRVTSTSGAANQDPGIPNIPRANLSQKEQKRDRSITRMEEKAARDMDRDRDARRQSAKSGSESASLDQDINSSQSQSHKPKQGQQITREHMAQLAEEQRLVAAAEAAAAEEADEEGSGGSDRHRTGGGGGGGGSHERPGMRRRRTRPPPRDVELTSVKPTFSAGSSSQSSISEEERAGTSSRASRASKSSRRPPMPTSRRSYVSTRSMDRDRGPDIVALNDMLESGTNSSTTASNLDINFDFSDERTRVREFFEKHGYMPAPRQPPEAARRRLRVIRRLGLEKPDDLHRTTLDRFTRLATSIFKTSKAIVSVIGRERQIFLSEIGMDTRSTGFEEAFCCHTIIGTGSACMVVPDANEDWRFSKNPLVREGKGMIQFYAGAPLVVGQGSKASIIGSMCVIDDRPRKDFGEESRRLLRDLAECVVSELELLYNQRATVDSAKLHQISVDFLRRSLKHRPNEKAGKSRQHNGVQSTTTGTSSNGSATSEGKRNSGADGRQSDENIDIFDEACQEIRFALDAHAVAIVDLSQFHLFYPSYQSSTAAGSTSAGGSRAHGAQSSRGHNTPAGSSRKFATNAKTDGSGGSGEDDPYSRSGNGRAARKTYTVTDPLAIGRTPQVLFVPSNSTSTGRTSKMAQMDSTNNLPILGYSCGSDDFAFNFSASPAGRKIVCDFIARNVKGRTVWYSRDDSEGIAESINHLMPPGTETSLAMPVFGFDGQVAFAVVGCWTDPLFSYPAGALQFVETIAGSLLASVMKERLHQAERAQLNFAAAASHELRTPLHQINAAAALLRQSLQSSLNSSPKATAPALIPLPAIDTELPRRNHNNRRIELTSDDRKEAVTHLEVIEANGSALGQILENIIDTLDIGRSTSSRATTTTQRGGVPIPLPAVPEEMHSLSDVLEDVVKDVLMQENKARRVAGEKGLEDVEVLLEVMPRVRGQWLMATDPGPLARAISKIIHNACKFTEKGYIHITVQDASRDVVLPGGYDNSIKLSQVVIDIKDTGRGMSPDFLDQTILRPFAKADPFKPGVGLGLGLAQRMIEILGGKLAIKSVLSRGTLVHIEVPLHLINGDNDSDLENMENQIEHHNPRSASPVRGDGIMLIGFDQNLDAGTRRVGRTLVRQFKLRMCRLVDQPQYASLILFPEGRLSKDEVKTLVASARPDVEVVSLGSARQALERSSNASAPPSPDCSTIADPTLSDDSLQITRLNRPLFPSVIRQITRPPKRVEPPVETYISDVVGGDAARQERAESVADTADQIILPSPPGGSPAISMIALSDEWSTSGSDAGSSGRWGAADANGIQNREGHDCRSSNDAGPTHVPVDGVVEMPNEPPVVTSAESPDVRAPGKKMRYTEIDLSGSSFGDASLAESTSRISLAEDASETPSSVATPTPISTEPGPLRVLVVEDNAVNRRILVSVLKRMACHYAEAVDGADAVKQFLAFGPDLVLLDINMPVKDGFQAATEMRAAEAEAGQSTKRAKIIAVTALSQEQSKRKGMLECGIDEWRTKPVSLKILREDVERMKI